MIKGFTKPEFRNFALATASNFFFYCNFSSFFLLPLYIKSLGGDDAHIGYIMGSFGITSLGAIPFVTFLVDKYGRRRVILLGSRAHVPGVALVHLRRGAFSVYLSHPPRTGDLLRVLLHGSGHVRSRLRPVRPEGAGLGHIQRVHYCRLRDRPFTRGVHHRARRVP